jgi:hypothetical protein
MINDNTRLLGDEFHYFGSGNVMILLKRLFRHSVDLSIKIPFVRQIGFILVEKLPFLRTLIMNMAGSSSVIIENGEFKLLGDSNKNYYQLSMDNPQEYLSKRGKELSNLLIKIYNTKR